MVLTELDIGGKLVMIVLHMANARGDNVAVMAERGMRNSVVDRAITAMRQFLRRIGFNLRFSEAELRQHVIAAARYVRDGTRPQGGGQREAAGAAAFSRSEPTKAAYEARIDALYAGANPKRPGVRVLDSSDMLGLLGYMDRPVVLAESKVNAAKHGMTAADWKKVPGWLDNPAAVFDSSQPGRLVFIAPELVNGASVRLILEPGDGNNLNLLVNAFDAHGHQPYMNWARDGRLRYLHESESPGQMGRSRLQLPGLPTSTEAVASPAFGERSGLRLPRDVRQLRGYKHKVLTEADLVKYRQADAAPDNVLFSQPDPIIDTIDEKMGKVPGVVVKRIKDMFRSLNPKDVRESIRLVVG